MRVIFVSILVSIGFDSNFESEFVGCLLVVSIGGELFSGMDIVIMSEMIQATYGVCQATEDMLSFKAR